MASEQIINRQCKLLAYVLDLPSVVALNSDACLLMRFSSLVAGSAIAKELLRIKVSSMNGIFTEDFLKSEVQNGNHESLSKTVNVIEELQQNYSDLDRLKSRITDCTDSLLNNLNQIKLLPDFSLYETAGEAIDLKAKLLEMDAGYSGYSLEKSVHTTNRPVLAIAEVHSSEVKKNKRDRLSHTKLNSVMTSDEIHRKNLEIQCYAMKVPNKLQDKVKQCNALESDRKLNISKPSDGDRKLNISKPLYDQNLEYLNTSKQKYILDLMNYITPVAHENPGTSSPCLKPEEETLNSCYKIFSDERSESNLIGAPSAPKNAKPSSLFPTSFDNFNVMRKRSRSTPSKFQTNPPPISPEITRETIAERKIVRSLLHSCSEDDLSLLTNEYNIVEEKDNYQLLEGKSERLLVSESLDSGSSRNDFDSNPKIVPSNKKDQVLRRKQYIESKKPSQNPRLSASVKKRSKSSKAIKKSSNKIQKKYNNRDTEIVDPSCCKQVEISSFKTSNLSNVENITEDSKINEALTTAEDANFSSYYKPIKEANKRKRCPLISFSEIELRTKAISAQQITLENNEQQSEKVVTVEAGTGPSASICSNKNIQSNLQVFYNLH